MGQIILVLGAFTLLIFMTMSVNVAISNRVDDTYQAQSIIAATTLAQSMMNQVNQKAFDDSVVIRPIDTVSHLTPVLSLGKDAGEVYPNFDDIDDFNNYTRADTITNGIFTTKVAVAYVNPANLGVASLARTFYKKITVTVTSRELRTIPISLTRICSY